MLHIFLYANGRAEKSALFSFENLLTFVIHKYIMNYVIQKKGDDRVSPRTGRPTDNPKGKPLTIRLDDEAKTILEAYCKQENVEKGEAARRGIKKLKSELKEKE